MGSESGKIILNIDGHDIETQAGTSVLKASLDAGIYIPHLCYHPDLSPIGNCRLCTVEIQGMDTLTTACTTPAANGMIVRTKTEAVNHMRRLAMELLLAGHPKDCDTCNKYLNCELQSLKQYLIGDKLHVRIRSKILPVNMKNPLFQHDPNKCVVCGRCVRACHELRGVGILQYNKKGNETYCGTFSDVLLVDADCKFCGACAEVCPTGAIADKTELIQGKKRRVALIPCRYNCPAEIDVSRYIRFIQEKDYASAAAVIREKVPFPGVLGYVCDHPCESVCRRGEVNQPVSIRELKRFAVGNSESETPKIFENRKPLTGKKVAVIGSGPAGLTAAFYLSKQGHTVTVFEALPLTGGLMRFGIPEYHLPRNVLDHEIEIVKKSGIEIKNNTRVEKIDTLFEQGYDAVVVAVGTHQGQKLKIPGTDGEGVNTCIDFLRDINLKKNIDLGNKVVVLGGGSVAFDCARVARRLGVGEVQIACLEDRVNMPASSDEIKQGEEEGVLVYPGRTATRIIREHGRIKGVEFLEVTSFGFDEDKNVKIEVKDNSYHILEANSVIFAIGQRPEIPAGFGLDTTTRHLVELDPYTLGTNREGVFAAGDVVSGTASVIKAIASGRKAAIAVDKFLGGDGDIEEKLAPETKTQDNIGRGEEFALMERVEVPCASIPERLQNFCPVMDDMDKDMAGYESSRCLQCDLRLKITPVKLWGSY
jgi:formate dehydrogenase beta subunit